MNGKIYFTYAAAFLMTTLLFGCCASSCAQGRGYVFGGWYADAALETRFDFTHAIVSGTVLYARWIPEAQYILQRRLEAMLAATGVALPDLYPAADKTIVGLFVTVDGRGIKDGSSWDNALPGDSLKKVIANIADAGEKTIRGAARRRCVCTP